MCHLKIVCGLLSVGSSLEIPSRNNRPEITPFFAKSSNRKEGRVEAHD